MKIIFLIAIFSFSISFIYGQNYCPLNKGETKAYEMKIGSYTIETLKEDVELNGQKYTPVKTIYSWGGESTTLIRLDKDGNRIYLDPKSNLETIEFPKNITLGYKWESTDKAWSYEISNLDADFRIKDIEFKKCLIIKATQLSGRDKTKHKVYLNYYVEEIGYVGSKTENKYVSWLK